MSAATSAAAGGATNGAISGGVLHSLPAMFPALALELRYISFSGERARLGAIAAISTGVAVLAAAAAHLPELWWAGMSGFMSVQATRPASLGRAGLRVIGTAVGAVLAVLLIPWMAYDHAVCFLLLWAIATIGIVGISVSAHGYAWLFLAITFILVTLMSLDQPLSVVDFAVYRFAEVSLGSAAAVAVTWALAPDGPSAALPAAAGWGHLLGAQWPALLHAARGGLAVMLIPLLWRWFEMPSLVQMPVTVAAVMAVPVVTADPAGEQATIVTRAAQRVVGCLFGGMVGIVVLAIGVTMLLPWLTLLACGVWLFAYLQTSTRGIGYIGTQGAIAFIMTLVQADGPPSSIIPGLDRFIGITLGLTVLLSVMVAMWWLDGPAPRPATQEGATP